MLKIVKVLIYTILSWSSFINADNTFGYMSYSTINIGDDIQTIAARRFLPRNSTPINREFVSQFNYPSKINTIMNGWFMHTKDDWWWNNLKPPIKSWPPSPSIDPLLISIHFTSLFFSKTLTNEGIEYLKEHGPVGARDYYTLEELQKRNVPCYFSGCLTLTLENTSTKRDDIIYAVDIDKECVRYIKSKTKSKVVVLSHGVPQKIQFDNEKRLKYAEELLNKYRRAKCVITGRLHAAMPCLAFETPVLFLGSPGHSRFQGLGELIRHCSSHELLHREVDFNFDHPPENPRDYIPIRENLIEIVTDWVERVKASQL